MIMVCRYQSILENEFKPIERLPNPTFSHVGEWIQGPILLNGNIVKCLVTLRSNTFKTGWVYNKFSTNNYLPKVAKLATKLDKNYPSVLEISKFVRVSNIPIGKGLGSSTSDLVSFANAFFKKINMRISKRDAYSIAIENERYSDPLYDERNFIFTSKQKREVFSLPVLGMKYTGILVFSKECDSVCTDSINFSYSQRHVEKFRLIQSAFVNGVFSNNMNLIFSASMASAEMNQEFFKMRDFDKIKSIIKNKIKGYSISHSGTAIVLHPKTDKVEEIIYQLRSNNYKSTRITITL